MRCRRVSGESGSEGTKQSCIHSSALLRFGLATVSSIGGLVWKGHVAHTSNPEMLRPGFWAFCASGGSLVPGSLATGGGTKAWSVWQEKSKIRAGWWTSKNS